MLEIAIELGLGLGLGLGLLSILKGSRAPMNQMMENARNCSRVRVGSLCGGIKLSLGLELGLGLLSKEMGQWGQVLKMTNDDFQ